MKTLAILSGLFALGNAHAAGGDAGCGLGSLIFKENTVMSQTAASTTNATFANQFFAITSGTSNCSRNGFALNEKKEIYFAEGNLPQLRLDVARGEGETLSAMADVLGCSKEVAKEFGSTAQAGFEAIFPNAATLPAEFLDNLKSELKKNSSLRDSCQSLRT